MGESTHLGYHSSRKDQFPEFWNIQCLYVLYLSLPQQLQADGVVMRTETDFECLSSQMEGALVLLFCIDARPIIPGHSCCLPISLQTAMDLFCAFWAKTYKAEWVWSN